MKSSYRIARVFGISVELHITFILLLVLLFFINWIGHGIISGIGTLIFFIILFSIVVLHELSHSLVALLGGIPVKRIILLPIGGLANVEIPEKPRLELVMSLAGPLFNFAFAILSLLLLSLIVPTWDGIIALAESIESMGDAVFTLPTLFILLIEINLVLGFFNLLPAFPMDGGRVLRAFLAFFMDYIEATRIAVSIGQFFSIFMIVFGLYYSPWLSIIGIFILFAGSQEFKVVKMKHLLAGVKAGEIANREMIVVDSGLGVKNFLELTVSPGQEYYPVCNENHQITGVVDLEDVKGIAQDKRDGIAIGKLARDFDRVDAKQDVGNTILKLLGRDFVIVTDSVGVVGYLTPSRIMQFAKFRELTK